VSQAGVLDLVDAAELGLGRDAVVDLLGGPPDAVPNRYALASPIARVPIGVPVLGVHGTADDNVPVRQTERFAAASGDRCTRLPGVDHFAVIDPSTPAWAACRAAVEEVLA
jgi:pimeloyl-ACP methyl ester carboxylesterase